MVILGIAGRELRSLFLSPLAWTGLAVMTAIHAYVMLIQIEHFTRWQPQLSGVAGAPGLTDLVVLPLFKTAGFVLLMVVPLVTMRLVSEERRSGTIALLMSSPVAMSEIVLGKYVGIVTYLLCLVGLIGLLPLSLLAGGDLDLGLFAAGLLGLVLMLAALAAVGLFVSTLTQDPTIAAVGTFELLLLLWILDWAGARTGWRLAAYLPTWLWERTSTPC